VFRQPTSRNPSHGLTHLRSHARPIGLPFGVSGEVARQINFLPGVVGTVPSPDVSPFANPQSPIRDQQFSRPRSHALPIATPGSSVPTVLGIPHRTHYAPAMRFIWHGVLYGFALLIAFLSPLVMAAPIPRSPELQRIVDIAASATLEHFAGEKLQSNQLAFTLVDISNKATPRQAGFRADAPIYPASVIKLFYLVAAHRWMEDGKLTETDELRRAIRDMIIDSSNDATHYVVDAITATTGGPELPPDEMRAWSEKRNAINRYFSSEGYTRINANQKPWCEGPYGREREFVGKNFANRNALTTEATARLLSEIVEGKAVSAARSRQMMDILQRNYSKKVQSDEPDQAVDFTGKALPPGAKLWSKAGWTSTARHDAAYIELPGGPKFVLVTFTTDHSKNGEIISFVARNIMERLKR
ncbi:MAG: hypothetical protein JWM16_1176, partial [Verrucomicrobiales bacterium]|nr:hypothetical protein [Verrucomicrobiales bacterium]